MESGATVPGAGAEDGGHGGAERRRPRDLTPLEVAEASDAVRRRQLVRQRVTEEAGLPAHARPEVADGAVHLVRSGAGRPVDRAALEVVEAPDSVGGGRLVGQRVAEEAVLAPEL